jgi:hypothetical protein
MCARFRILRGIHCDKDAKLIFQGEIDGLDRNQQVAGTFFPGDVIECDKDLLRHNTDPLNPRCELVSQADDLDSYTVAQLKEFAAAEHIDLPTSKMGKQRMLEAIRATLKYREAIGSA